MYLVLLLFGCSDILKTYVDTGTGTVPYDEIVVTTTDAETVDTGCDSGELCDTAG
tara:strand:- start:307 stop:471 length:165 start_codon:yes stop_codon:yes gene_type:complete